MNSREHLADDLDTLIKRTKQIGYVAWAVAILVMIFGTPIVYGFLTAHQIPGKVAWMLSLAADGALIVGLIATPVLAQLEVPAGWVGTLRYVAGFSTWALQTAGSWTATGGIDPVGVVAHSFGPVLLFFAVEAASSFQRKVAGALTAKNRELEAAEQKDADRRAHLAELEASLRTAQVELNVAEATIENLNARLDAVTAAGEADKVNTNLTVERLQARIGELTTALTEQAERHNVELAEKDQAHHAELNDTVRRLKDKHTEKLNAVRAEASTVSLNAYRQKHTDRASTEPAGKPAMSDEAAVQAMLNAHDDPSFEWSKNAVRTLTGVGFARAERLIELWFTAATDKAASGKAVNQ